MRPFFPFGFLTIETSQSGRYGGVDEDGSERDLVSIFTSGTKCHGGRRRSVRPPIMQEPLLGWRMMGSHLVSAPFTVLANAPLGIKKTQSVWGEIWLPLGRNTREIHREKFHSNRRAPGSRPGRPTNLPPVLSSSCIPKLTLEGSLTPAARFRPQCRIEDYGLFSVVSWSSH